MITNLSFLIDQKIRCLAVSKKSDFITILVNMLLMLMMLFSLIISAKSSFAADDDRPISSLKNRSTQNANSSSMAPEQTNAVNQPILKRKEINRLPALSFDGTDDFMNYGGESLARSNYTIFVVEKRNSNKANNYFFGITNSNPSNNEGLILGYKTNGSIVFAQGSNEETIPVENYNSDDEPVRLHTFIQDDLSGKKYYRNGALIFSDNTNISSLDQNSNTVIGRNANNYFSGSIGEVAIYKRALGDAEIKNINDYLINKWSIQEIKDGTKCTPSSPGYVNNSNVEWSNSGSANHNGLITATCINGTILQGTLGPLTCKNGVYIGDVTGSCESGGGVCGNPDSLRPIANGTWGVTSAANGQTLTGNCNSGYYPYSYGEPTITCTDGTYTNRSGGCSPYPPCTGNPNSIVPLNNGSWPNIASLNLYKHVAGICNNGYVGNPDLTCISTGNGFETNYSRSGSTCELVSCGNPNISNPIANGYWGVHEGNPTVIDYEYNNGVANGEVVYGSCDSNHVIAESGVANASMTCNNGSYTLNQSITCIEATCQDPTIGSPLDGGYWDYLERGMVANDVAYGYCYDDENIEVTITCLEGGTYEVSGSCP